MRFSLFSLLQQEERREENRILKKREVLKLICEKEVNHDIEERI
jgi:hypothetical protein